MKYLATLLLLFSLNAKADITPLVGIGQKSDHSLQSLNQSGSQSVTSLEVLISSDRILYGAEYINYKETKLLKIGYSLDSNLSLVTGAGIRSEDQITSSSLQTGPGQIQNVTNTEKRNVTVLWPIEVIYKFDKFNLGAEIITGDTYQAKIGWTF